MAKISPGNFWNLLEIISADLLDSLGTHLVLVLQQLVDGFGENPVELGVKAIETAVHANSHVRFIDTPNQRRNACLMHNVSLQ